MFWERSELDGCCAGRRVQRCLLVPCARQVAHQEAWHMNAELLTIPSLDTATTSHHPAVFEMDLRLHSNTGCQVCKGCQNTRTCLAVGMVDEHDATALPLGCRDCRGVVNCRLPFDDLGVVHPSEQHSIGHWHVCSGHVHLRPISRMLLWQVRSFEAARCLGSDASQRQRGTPT